MGPTIFISNTKFALEIIIVGPMWPTFIVKPIVLLLRQFLPTNS